MEHYAGLDVSLKEISICVVDHDGKTIARGLSCGPGRRGRLVSQQIAHATPDRA